MDKTLFKEEWLSIKQHNGYTYVHEEKCNGALIAMLPYRIVDGKKEYLMRKELIPSHSNYKELCVIIGGCDDLELNPDQVAVKELKEEAGYEVSMNMLMSLGWVWGYKAADTKVYLYAINISDIEQGEATTDGTELEKDAYCEWLPDFKCFDTHDPMFYTIASKLHKISSGTHF